MLNDLLQLLRSELAGIHCCFHHWCTCSSAWCSRVCRWILCRSFLLLRYHSLGSLLLRCLLRTVGFDVPNFPTMVTCDDTLWITSILLGLILLALHLVTLGLLETRAVPQLVVALTLTTQTYSVSSFAIAHCRQIGTVFLYQIVEVEGWIFCVKLVEVVSDLVL